MKPSSKQLKRRHANPSCPIVAAHGPAVTAHTHQSSASPTHRHCFARVHVRPTPLLRPLDFTVAADLILRVRRPHQPSARSCRPAHQRSCPSIQLPIRASEPDRAEKIAKTNGILNWTNGASKVLNH
ncbi:hypothetical protein PF008_g20415 [Phytophthora fragariae]|uniref:Uncharacterized protein n=1 Tax=Phytophthora fragariae TaxID=53985 RepID=A0A6G0QZQ0_9STRA|nr:hypothetical protein PF008_g20415 [Phytophthora fragariae]